MRTSFLYAGGAVGLLAIGCASQPAPNEQIASSLAAVRGAEEAGALQVPEAALHVKLAEEEIQQAQALVDDDNQRAADLALRAYNDAELAIALARENEAKQRLEKFAEANRTAGGEQPAAAPGTPGSSTTTTTTTTSPRATTPGNGAAPMTTQPSTTQPSTTQPSTTQPSGLPTRPRSGQTVTD